MNSAKEGTKRILIVSQHFWPESFRITDIAECFVEQGIEVDVLCGIPNYPKGDWFPGYSFWSNRFQRYKGINVYRAGEIPRKKNKSLTIFLNYVSWPLFALLNLRRLPGGYTAILCFNTSPVLMCIPALRYGKKHKIPVVEYVCDLWPDNLYSVLNVRSKFWRSVAERCSNFIYSGCDKLMTVSDGAADALVDRIGVSREHIRIIPQYCEDFYAIPQTDDSLSTVYDDRFSLVYAGNLSPAQDMESLLKAIAALDETMRHRLHLIIVGDGMSRDSLEKLTDSLHLSDTVSFLGSVKPHEIPKYTTPADAMYIGLVHSSNLGLTVPSKVSSVLAAGKPVLSCLEGEAAREMKEADCGPVCASGNVEELTQAICTLIEADMETRTRWSENASDCYHRKYSRKVVLQQMMDFILE